MLRLIALLWLALSLAFASGPASAMPAPDCPMAGSAMPDHDEMDCCAASCAPECAIACPSGMMPMPHRFATSADLVGEQPVMRLVQALASADLTGTDPPPRTTFS